jgi:acyl-CoA synthetase (AMP-forming)/AMP-acid ligase II
VHDFPNLTDAIFEHAAKRPKMVALEDMTGRLTYRQFADHIGRASVWLRSLGIEPGQPVGVRLANSADHLILSLALMRVGAAKIEFGSAAGPQFDATARMLGVKTLFIEPPARAGGDIRCVTIGAGWRQTLAGFKGDFRHDGMSPEPTDILLSSGSTGPSKGVPCTHRLTLGRLADWNPTFLRAGLVSDDYSGTFLHVSSMSFTGFLLPLLARLVTGGKVVILPEFSKLLDFVRAIRAHDEAILMVTAGMCQELLSCAPEEGLLFPDVRAIVCAGTPLPAEAKRQAIRSLTPNFTEMYGNAGAGMLTALFPEEIPAHADSVGRVIPSLTVEIVDGADRPIGAGVAGFLRCRGSGVVEGLVNSVTSSAGFEGIRDGWYYPGDVAAIDAEGYLHLKGRAADAVTRRGVRVFPTVVEMALLSCPGVRDVAVLGLGSGRDTMVVAAIVADTEDGRALHEFCVGAIGAEHAPDSYMFSAALPRTAAGKTDRAKLRQQAEKLVARQRAAP